MARSCFALLALLLLGTLPLFGQSGRLELLREELASPKSNDDDRDRKKDKDDDKDEDDPGPPIAAASVPVACAAAAEVLHPATQHGLHWFLAWPYAGDEPGYLSSTFVEGSTLSCRLTLEAGTNFDDLARYGGQLWLEDSGGLGLLVRGHHYRETLPGQPDDSVTRGSVDATFRIVSDLSCQVHLGIGANFLDAGRDSYAGINALTGFDWFPAKPFIVSGVFDIGNLGKDLLLHGRASIGVNFDRVEVLTGYDWLRIGRVTLDGLFVGVRFWF